MNSGKRLPDGLSNEILKNLLVYLFCFRLLLPKLFGLFLLIFYAGIHQ